MSYIISGVDLSAPLNQQLNQINMASKNSSMEEGSMILEKFMTRIKISILKLDWRNSEVSPCGHPSLFYLDPSSDLDT